MRLDSTKVVQVAMKLATIVIHKGLTQAEALVGLERQAAIYKLIGETLPRNLIITQYNMKFRNCVFGRLVHFSDLENPDYKSCSDEFITRMIAVAENTLLLLNTRFPYLHEVSTATTDAWSPVDGGPPVVVESWATGVKRSVIPKDVHVKRAKRSRWGFAERRYKDSW